MFTVTLHLTTFKQEEREERELILFRVSLREISSDFNDSHSPELTLAKINKRKRNAGCGVTVNVVQGIRSAFREKDK